MGNHFTSTWEHSSFRKGPMFARNVPGGKRTLFGREYRRWTGPASVAERIDAERFPALVRDTFGIELDGDRAARLAAFYREMA
jgi:arylamine N-acetyltransferase